MTVGIEWYFWVPGADCRWLCFSSKEVKYKRLRQAEV